MRNDNDVYVDDVFDKLKQFIKRIFRLIFRVLALFWSKKLIFLALIVVGLAVGFFLDINRATRFESVLQVRTFQSSTEYVYNIIDNLNKNLGDTLYLEENGFKKQELQSIEITPMANMEDLLSTFRNDDSRTLETLILNTSTQDLLTSEFFRSQYSQHRIAVKFGENFDKNTIAHFLSFLNSNNYYEDLYKLQQESYLQRIKENQNAIAKIDTLIANYNGNLKGKETGNSAITAIVNEQRATSVFDLLKFRNELIRDIESLKINLKELTAPVTLTNKPIVLEQDGLIKNRTLFIPLLLTGIFALTLILVAFYRKMKHWVQKP